MYNLTKIRLRGFINYFVLLTHRNRLFVTIHSGFDIYNGTLIYTSPLGMFLYRFVHYAFERIF